MALLMMMMMTMMMVMIEYMGYGLRFYSWLGIGTRLMSPND